VGAILAEFDILAEFEQRGYSLPAIAASRVAEKRYNLR